MRPAVWFAAGILVGALAVLAATGDWSPLVMRSSLPFSVPTSMAPGGHVREFHLEARPAKWEIAPGIVTGAWTYNGQVPGPELRVKEGDLVRVIVTNHLPVPTTIHWHGINLNYKMDGVPGITQDPIQPGQTFTYEFIASPAGTRMYHSHQDSNAQMELGLYGALIIEPRTGPTYDVDRTIILDERALDFTPEVAMGQKELRNAESGNGRGGTLNYDLFLMDGKAGSAIPPVNVKPNQRMLLRLINLGNLAHAIHLHGHIFTIVATDGNPVPPGGRLQKDTVLIGPGERYDLEVVAYNPGIWMFHCHMPGHADNGMMTVMQYEGFKAVSSTDHQHQVVQVPGLSAAASSAGVPAQPVISAPAPAFPKRVLRTASGPVISLPILDNRFAPTSITVRAGTTIKWLNRGQNIHTTTSLDGLWDSPGLEHRQSFSFTFTKPGEYRYLCRQHLLNGMVGTIIVK